MGLQDVLAQYNSIFGALVGLRIMSWQLQQQWRQAVQQQGGVLIPAAGCLAPYIMMSIMAMPLTALWYYADDCKSAPHGPVVLQRLLKLRTFRAAAAQLVTALQAHVCGQLHGSALTTALQDIQAIVCCWQSSLRLHTCKCRELAPELCVWLQAAQDLDAARAVMSCYMDRALQACLMLDSPGERHISQLLTPVLQCISTSLSAFSSAR